MAPVRDRKFRVADKDLSSFLDQVDEFCDLAMEGINEELPQVFDYSTSLLAFEFINNLCSELRLNRKIANQLKDIPTSKINLIPSLLAAIFAGQIDIDMETARNLQIAITNYIIEGRFK